MSYEVEIKIKIDCKNMERIKRKIIDGGGKVVRSQIETDYYMLHPCKDFLSTDEALRVRYVDGSVESLTYKGPRIGKDAKSRYEIIVSIKEGDIIGLLEKLGFKTGIVVKKHREYYTYGDVLITLDKVDGLGCFVELELISGESERELYNVAKRLDLTGSILVKSYAELLWEKTASSK